VDAVGIPRIRQRVTRVTATPFAFCQPVYGRHVQATTCGFADARADGGGAGGASDQLSLPACRSSGRTNNDCARPRRCSQVLPLEFRAALRDRHSPFASEHALRQRARLLHAPKPCKFRRGALDLPSATPRPRSPRSHTDPLSRLRICVRRYRRPRQKLASVRDAERDSSYLSLPNSRRTARARAALRANSSNQHLRTGEIKVYEA
jgi:hypothetical protein